MTTQVKGAASSSTAACISDDEEEDEVKDLPPPPPPPPPPIPSTTSTEPLVFQRQRKRIAEARNLRLAARFHRQVVLLRCVRGSIADKVHIRGALVSWVDATALLVQKEKIVLATILNRWSMLVEERKHRRALNEMALQHWACNICKRTLRQWKGTVEAIREEQKAMFRRSMHSTSHSLRMLPPPRPLALPSLSLLSNSFNRNDVVVPPSSGLVKTNLLTGSINFSRPSTNSLKAISTQHASPIRTTSPTPRHKTLTSHRTKMVAKQWTSPITDQQQTRQLLPQLNEVRISSNGVGVKASTNTNSSASGGSPFGVRVPRWIQEEISGRYHQSNMVPRYR